MKNTSANKMCSLSLYGYYSKRVAVCQVVARRIKTWRLLYPCVTNLVRRCERWWKVARCVMFCNVLHCSNRVVGKSLKSKECSNVPFFEKK